MAGKYRRSPEDIARHQAIHEKFSRERPSLQQLIESGDAEEVITQGEMLDRLQVAATLRKEREIAGLSLSELSEQTGMDKGALSKLETGANNPTIGTLSRYARALGKQIVVSLVELSKPPSRRKAKR